MKQIIAGLLCCVALNAGADIKIKFSGENHCDALQGSWAGTGFAKMGLIKCKYEGDGTLLGYGSVFQASLRLQHTGSELCPDRDNLVFTGNCDADTGILTINMHDVHMDGAVDELGTHIEMKGNMKLNGLKFDLTTSLDKLG